MSFTIPAPAQKYLEVYLGESKQPKRVPVAGSLPAPWLIRINKTQRIKDAAEREGAWFELFYDLFRAYLGADVDLMTANQINELAEAWSSAGEEQDGATEGE